MILYELNELYAGSIILCPECEGKGVVYKYKDAPEGYYCSDMTCLYCSGKGRVVIRHDKLREGS